MNPALRRLYFFRAAFAIAWAAVTLAVARDLTPAAVALFVLYPLVDAGAAVADLRSARGSGPRGLLYVNIAVSTLAAAGVAVAATSGIPAVVRVWGAWAVVAGLIQLVVGAARRRTGGQWPLIVSGGLSALIGAGFIVSAGAADPSLAGPAGYAIGGGVLFLISALRLGRRDRVAAPAR